MTTPHSTATPPKNMSLIPGGTYWMGSEDFYPEERPVHQVTVDGFWMDTTAVTVAEFRRFVKATGHVTTAEIAPDPADYPDADPALLVPGSLVFNSPPAPVSLDDYTQWWSFTPGADWRHPEGADSNIGGRERHPVTHVSYFDAQAYAAWAGKELPTEAEWEFAARGGLDRQAYVWGDHDSPGGRPGGNVWQGQFPWENLLEDGYERTAPVGKFRPNGYGLFDMAGNVWEWTADHYTSDHAHSSKNVAPASSCCIPRNPRAEFATEALAGEPYARRVIKGGSHLCAPNYCLRYRPAARQGESEESSTCHVGFRCIIRIPQE
ncbi:formylglycine-generating enzyme family protein [Rhodococcus cerastii]|uniref:formylglycine-generating enzyme family protein n=1 Tax=Rhodococcus erythropolis TaxID=1833 RepID=UPI0040437537|nr:formylglycine-generating enzyme family protein [Rhodococcus cerastii]